MILRFPCRARLRTISLSTLLMALACLTAWGCGGAPVAPPSPAVQAPEDAKEEQQAWNPFVVVEPGGRIFLTYYGGRGGDQYQPFFTRSLDGGMTWLSEPVRLDEPHHPRARLGFHQLETNGAGRLSATWSIEGEEGQIWRVRELRHRHSSDSGATWTEQLLKRPFLAQSNYPRPVTGPDGTLYLIFTEGAAAKSELRFIRTTGPEMAWIPAPVTLPGVDGSEKTKSMSAHWPVLAIEPPGALYAVWQATTLQGNEIFFNQSQDGGTMWLPSSLRLNRPTDLGNYTARIPVIAVNGGEEIYVVWEDFRHNTYDLYFNRSLDRGTSWLDQEVWLTAVRPPQAAATGPVLSADRSGNLYLLWSDIREAPKSLFFSRSLDRGATWMPHPIRVDHHDQNAITFAHRLAHDDAGHVYVAWWEGTDATKGSIHVNRSDDYGATWLEKEHILDSPQGKDGPRFPWLSADGQGGVYVVWSSNRSGRYHLYLNRSLDHGKTWLPQPIKITGDRVRRPAGS